MTRTPFAHHHPLDGEESSSSDTLAAMNLTRLLARLEHNLLSPSADLKPLRRSPYHRARVGANIEYARSLLLQLERALPKIKRPDRRHERQTDLARKRQTLQLLKDRLDGISADAELRATTAATAAATETEMEGEITSDEEEEEDLLATPDEEDEDEEEEGEEGRTPPSEMTEENDETGTYHHHPSQRTADEPPDTINITPSTTIVAATETASTLRHRQPSHPHPTPPSATPPSAPTSATTTGFSQTHTQTTSTKRPTTDQTLTAHLHEQESLTASLLQLATQLKASSQSLQRTLEAEKPLLARAVAGLDRNVAGLEAAGQKMGMLRRMTEGRGWWGRVMMYVWIFALWIVAVGIVFLGPKVR